MEHKLRSVEVNCVGSSCTLFGVPPVPSSTEKTRSASSWHCYAALYMHICEILFMFALAEHNSGFSGARAGMGVFGCMDLRTSKLALPPVARRKYADRLWPDVIYV